MGGEVLARLAARLPRRGAPAALLAALIASMLPLSATPALASFPLNLSPTSGSVGASVTITTSGWNATDTLNFTWDNPSGQVASCVTDGTGNLTAGANCTFSVPANSPAGLHTLSAADTGPHSGPYTGSGTFTVTASPTSTPTSTTVPTTTPTNT